MPETTAGGIQYPIAGDLIKQDSIEAKLARDMMSLALTADTAINIMGEKIGWKGRDLVAGDDLDTILAPSNYAVTSTGVLNRPGPEVGNLTVTKLGNFVGQMFLTYGNPQSLLSRYWNGSVWSDWDSLRWRGSDITTPGFDLNAIKTYGIRAVKTTSAVNTPIAGKLGTVTTYPLGNFTGQTFTIYDSVTRYFHRRGAGTTWQPWDEMATVSTVTTSLNTAKTYTDEKINAVALGEGLELAGGGAKRREYEDIVRRGKGGVIGTGGKAAFAFRFDHNLDQLLANVWPLFESRGIPGSYHVLSDSMGNPTAPIEPTVAGWGDLRTIHRQGCDVWAHSATHSNPAPDKDLAYEIVSPRDAITANGMRCMGWSTPGGPATYGGSLSSPDNMDSEAGRLIRSHYGLYETSMAGTSRRILPTNGCRGHDHVTLDNMTAAAAIAVIDEAVAFGYGVEFMMHPNAIGQTGRLSVAGLAEVLDHLVSLRASGDAYLLTSSGLAFADPGTARRFDLNPTGQAAADVVFPVRTMGLDGHTFELVAKARATAGGTATFTVLSNDQPILNKSTALAAGTEWQTIRVPFLAAGRDANTVTLQFGGAGVEWSEAHAYPI